ncbi:MAG: hypothetical protein SXQ77_12195 [Halobacteria archaeon]|nr:hypothetical protein [Halobacteria archaeon]
MSAIPGGLDTQNQPPMAVPLRHFLVGLGFLVAGMTAGIVAVSGNLTDTLAHVHLLLAGWVCITIMGAMTQFVPVWSGTELHSRRLSSVQLVLVAFGVAGFAASLFADSFVLLPVFGTLMLAGFWVFVYNISRTLPPLGELDVTERHFALALAFFVLLSVLGLVLAVDITYPVLPDGVTHQSVLRAHATLAVFGAVLTTVLGALYQLVTMFTQTELRGYEIYVQRFEEAAYPAGVVLLATGRLVRLSPLTKPGAVLISLSLLGFGVVLLRKLYETKVERTPMLSRYAVVGISMIAWSVLAPVNVFSSPTLTTFPTDVPTSCSSG